MGEGWEVVNIAMLVVLWMLVIQLCIPKTKSDHSEEKRSLIFRDKSGVLISCMPLRFRRKNGDGGE